MRRPISTAAHGLLDYPVGILLIVSPWLWGFGFFVDGAVAASLVPVVLGVLILGQSLVTDYEFSVLPILPMKLHLGMDVIGGAFLAVSPWIFGFTSVDATTINDADPAATWVFHVVVGIGLVAAGLLTRTERPATPTETQEAIDPAAPEAADASRPRGGSRFRREGAAEPGTGTRDRGGAAAGTSRRDRDHE